MTRFIFIFVILVWVMGGFTARTSAQVNVTQKNNNPSRNGLYIDPAFTPGNAANLVRDLNFDGTIVGNVHAQPLYIEGGPNGPMIIVVTASNNIYALDADTGRVIWQRTNIGPPVTSGLPCGNINPVGTIGTPVVDLASRSLFFDSLIDGVTKKHFIYSLNVDTGVTKPGWPVDVNATAMYNGIIFNSLVQEDRGALAVVNGIVYVPYSGYGGDCGAYHGWVVGVHINNPLNVGAWATTAAKGGIWGHSGVASDGTNMFVITGNTTGTGGVWGGGEAIIRLQAGPFWTGMPSDYWAPTNWLQLDNGDSDLGGVSALLVDVPGANPSQLVLATGKDSNAYLLNRNNLGGITAPVAQLIVGSVIGQSSATYRTPQGTYFVFRATSNQVKAYKITATSPPTIVSAWSVSQTGQGSPWVTTTDGANNAIVWVVGAQGDGKLHGYDGDSGTQIYAGTDVMSGTRKWNSGIVARGSLYVANDNKVYAFRVLGGTSTPTPTPTATPTSTPRPTATATPRPTATATPRPTATPTATATATPCAAPTVTTSAASNVASSSATLNGTINPNGCNTTIHFQYGTTTSYGSTTANQTKTGNTTQNVAADISGLAANATYHFRIVATNSGGTRYGSDTTFTTTEPPAVTTKPATKVASFSARLNGKVDPHGLSTTVRFQYGTTTSYGSTTVNQTKTGNKTQNVATNISALAANTTYHFRIVATNSGGTRYGSDRSFTTLSAKGAPIVTTNLATNVTNSSATLNGTVNPHGLSTTVYLQYGRTRKYGSRTPNRTKTGNTYRHVSANISGLSAGTTYHFRIVGTNAAGTRHGVDRTFTTH